MTKADIARVVYERHGGISNREAARLVEIIFDSIKRHLGDGDKVQITGFGTVLVRQKKERRGRNPQTGEERRTAPVSASTGGRTSRPSCASSSSSTTRASRLPGPRSVSNPR